MEQANRTTETGRKLFLLSYVLVLVRILLSTSTLTAYFDAQSVLFKYVFRVAALLPIAAKFLTQDRFSPSAFLVYLLFGGVCLSGCLMSGSFVLLDFAVLAVGMHGLELRDAVRTFFYTASAVYALLFLLSITGVIENFVSYRDDIPRYAFGTGYATDFAAMLFYIELAHAYLKRGKYSFADLCVWTAAALFVYVFCNARLDFALILLFALSMFVLSRRKAPLGSSFTRACLLAAVPVLCFGSIALHIFYTPENAFLEQLNTALSGRLYYGNVAIKDYGFSLFGQKIVMQGWGFDPQGWDEALGYYYVDCGWLSVALSFGVFMPLFLCACFLSVMRREFRMGKSGFVLPLILLFISVTSTVDQHIFDVGYDPFLLCAGWVLLRMAVFVHDVKFAPPRKTAKRTEP